MGSLALLQLRRSQIFQYHLAHAVPSVMPSHTQCSQCLFEVDLNTTIFKKIQLIHIITNSEFCVYDWTYVY